MKGTLQKHITAHTLECCTCFYFRDEDPDIFYCQLQREEFPALCEQYLQSAKIADERSDWAVLE